MRLLLILVGILFTGIGYVTNKFFNLVGENIIVIDHKHYNLYHPLQATRLWSFAKVIKTDALFIQIIS